MINLIKAQHKHFGILYEGKPRHISKEEKTFYHAAFVEEALEYLEADTLEEEYDAILDLLVFTMGAMLRHGFKPEGLVEVVQANLQKEIGPQTKRGGFELDLIKPEGWNPPNLKAYL